MDRVPQLLLEPFKRLPQQFQNWDIVKKLQEFTIGKHVDNYGFKMTSTYGAIDGSSSIAFDDMLGLLAVGSESGLIKIFGAPGIVFTIQNEGPEIKSLFFLPGEGRLVFADVSGYIKLYELNSDIGRWTCTSRVCIQKHGDDDVITCMTLGLGVIFVGFANGTLRQVAVKDGHMTLGDDFLTACLCEVVTSSIPEDKRSQFTGDTPIISLEVEPETNQLLIAYASGFIAVAVPQSVLPETEPVKPAETNGTTSDETVPVNGVDADAPVEETKTSKPTSVPEVPIKELTEKRSTLKFRSLTRSLRHSDATEKELAGPKLSVPLAPRISHLILCSQTVKCATWRLVAANIASTEVVVAYDDGAFQAWPIVSQTGDQSDEPVIVAMRDPPNTPYGPMPCGAIKKLFINPGSRGPLTIFSGGLPRPQYENRHTVSVLQDHEHHVCFQFGSIVKDFLLIPSKQDLDAKPNTEWISKPSSCKAAVALLVLTEKELIAIDLIQSNWPAYDSPYLNCLTCSPVTSIAHIGQVPTAIIQKLATKACMGRDDVTTNPWPIWGGAPGIEQDLTQNIGNDVVALGHANGWVTLWALGRGDTCRHLGTLPTAVLFNNSDLENDSKYDNSIQEEVTWPPFRITGFHSVSERYCHDQPDSRLAITTLSVYLGSLVNGVSDAITLVIGQAAGQVSIWTFGSNAVSFEPDISTVRIQLINSNDEAGYTWTDAKALRPREGAVQFSTPSGVTFHPTGLIQVYPPGPITSIALDLAWHVLAVGSSHGFSLIDIFNQTVIHQEFTYIQSATAKAMNAVSNVQTAIRNRGKQFSHGIRQSFRRLKNFRTTLTNSDKVQHDASVPEDAKTEAKEIAESENVNGGTTVEPTAQETKKEATTTDAISTTNQQPTSAADQTSEEAVVVLPPEPIKLTIMDGMTSAVRSFLFADTYLLQNTTSVDGDHTSNQTHSPTFWVGLNSGKVLAYTLTWPEMAGPITMKLCKELQLHHGAPVIAMFVIDTVSHGAIPPSERTRTSCVPVVNGTSSTSVPEKDTESSAEEAPAKIETTTTDIHQLLLCSEEQVKLFALPSLRAIHKRKFVDRLKALGMSAKASPAIVSQSAGTTATSQKTDEEVVNGEQPAVVVNGEENQLETVVNTVKTIYTTYSTVQSRKRITSFGLQNFVLGDGDQAKVEWNAVVTLVDGKSTILSLPSFRQLLKGRNPSHVQSALSVVASQTFNTSVFWAMGSQMVAAELGPITTLNSLAVALVDNKPATNFVAISLPEWIRPRKPVNAVEVEAVQQTVEQEQQPETAKITTETTTSDTVNKIDEKEKEPIVEQVKSEEQQQQHHNGVLNLNGHGLSDSSLLSQPDAINDTMDIIKEYIHDNNGISSIRTTESASAKHTLVEAGKITTTVHEVEKIDGKIVKNDVMKIVSDGEQEMAAVPGNA